MNPQLLLTLLTTAGPLVQQFLPQIMAALPGIGGIFGGAVPSASGPMVTMLQNALNAMQAVGTIQFDGQAGIPNSPLIADGHFGGRTFAAIKKAQSHFGFDVVEPMASMEMNLIATLLNKLQTVA